MFSTNSNYFEPSKFHKGHFVDFSEQLVVFLTSFSEFDLFERDLNFKKSRDDC